MNRLIKVGVTILILVTCSLLTLHFTSQYLTRILTAPVSTKITVQEHENIPTPTMSEADIKKDNMQKLYKYISQEHEWIGMRVIYGRYEELKRNKNSTEWKAITESSFTGTNDYVAQLTDNQNIIKDFDDVNRLMEYAKENKDADAVLWAHRILHDLYEFLDDDYTKMKDPPGNPEYFRATRTFEGDKGKGHLYLEKVEKASSSKAAKH